MDNIKKVKMLDGKEMYFKEEDGNFIEVKKPLNRRFKPLDDEVYFWISNDGRIYSSYFAFGLVDDYRSNSNNMFKTREEAERKLEITKILHEYSYNFSLKELEDNSIFKYYIYADIEHRKLLIACKVDCCYREHTFFEDKKHAKEAIDLIGYDDYLKYVLGIYEE